MPEENQQKELIKVLPKSLHFEIKNMKELFERIFNTANFLEEKSKGGKKGKNRYKTKEKEITAVMQKTFRCTD